MSFCKCLEPIDVKQRVFDIIDEVKEFFIAVCIVIIYFVKLLFDCIQIEDFDDALDDVYDEWSDIMFGFGRLFGNMRGIVYISMPGDKRHVDKVTYRYKTTGCCRSLNHKGCRVAK
jgi:hypothetical protein